jgi:hypothetical protein
MDKVSIRLAGGLGNFLFQIATAYAYAKRHNKKIVLNKDNSVTVHKHLDTYSNNILSNCQEFFSNEKVGGTQYHEQGFHYTEIPYISGDVYLNTYFQSSRYFDDVDIKTLFIYPEEESNRIMFEFNEKYKNVDMSKSCSIHVRRGDYLKFPDHHPTQTMAYYSKAIKKMPKDSVFLIFSDDINWCKENFPDAPNKFIFIEGNKDFEDLHIMTKCAHNIIANSTFSWWGAYLNENNDNKSDINTNITIVPSIWFGGGYPDNDIKDLYLPQWIKI